MAKIDAKFGREMIIAESNQEAQRLYDQARYGELVRGNFQYSFVEALYLIEKNKMDVVGAAKINYVPGPAFLVKAFYVKNPVSVNQDAHG